MHSLTPLLKKWMDWTNFAGDWIGCSMFTLPSKSQTALFSTTFKLPQSPFRYASQNPASYESVRRVHSPKHTPPSPLTLLPSPQRSRLRLGHHGSALRPHDGSDQPRPDRRAPLARRRPVAPALRYRDPRRRVRAYAHHGTGDCGVRGCASVGLQARVFGFESRDGGVCEGEEGEGGAGRGYWRRRGRG